jgi:hypothetical protein
MLEYRGDHSVYYYRNERQGDWVTRVYVASGARALELAARDEREREEGRAEWRAMRERHGAALKAARDKVGSVDALLAEWSGEFGKAWRAFMINTGWYQHKCEWRRRRMSLDERLALREEVKASLAAIQNGDPKLAPLVKAAFDANPRLIELCGGDLANKVVAALIDLVAGSNLFDREAVHRKLEEVCKDLAGPDPSPLEKLLASRAAVCWLAVHEAELQCLEQERGEFLIKPAEFFERRAARANRKFLLACRELAVARRLAHRRDLACLIPPPPSAPASTPTSIPAPEPALSPAVEFGGRLAGVVGAGRN